VTAVRRQCEGADQGWRSGLVLMRPARRGAGVTSRLGSRPDSSASCTSRIQAWSQRALSHVWQQAREICSARSMHKQNTLQCKTAGFCKILAERLSEALLMLRKHASCTAAPAPCHLCSDTKAVAMTAGLPYQWVCVVCCPCCHLCRCVQHHAGVWMPHGSCQHLHCIIGNHACEARITILYLCYRTRCQLRQQATSMTLASTQGPKLLPSLLVLRGGSRNLCIPKMRHCAPPSRHQDAHTCVLWRRWGGQWSLLLSICRHTRDLVQGPSSSARILHVPWEVV
jgi:hypothetical protein